ncbi:AI-2E family transporter [Oscillospiraceae bacterium PP1C4]
MDKHKIKSYCIVATFTVVLYLGLSNLNKLSGMVGMMLHLLAPFIIGLVIAFILNDMMTFFERKVFYRLGNGKSSKSANLIRGLSLLATYLLMFAGIAILLTVVVPQLATSIAQLGINIPIYTTSLQKLAEQLSAQFSLPPEIWTEINSWFQGTAKALLDFVVSYVPRVFDFVVSFGGGVFNGIIGVIVSIHILLCKEQLLSQLARLNRAFMPKPAANFAADSAVITAQTFGNYVTGQLLDALLVGIVSVLGLSILGFPYAMLIGFVMGVTNIIPFFGPFIGAVPGFFIILMIDPIKALWYILFVLIVQQIDGNIIAPKIIGSSVGLPPLWVLFAVTVGGALFGVVGMVLGTPIFAVFYILLGRSTRAREAAASKQE